MAYSYSRIDLYEKCPWAFKKVYRDGIKRPTNEALEIGTALHARIAAYLERLIQTKSPTDWRWAERKQVAGSDAAAIWEQFYQNFTLPQPVEDPGVENKLGFDRNWQPCGFFDPEVHFRGVIDFHFRQNSLAVVVDWKTNHQVPENVDKNLQLRVYGWAVKQAVYPDVEEILLRLHFLRYGVNREVLLSPHDLATVPDELDEKIARIEGDTKFEPNPGSFCGWCGLTAHCPVMARALVPVEVIAPADREDAQKAATLLLALQVMEKELASRLKEWVKENGSVPVGDLIYGPKAYRTCDLDAQAVVEQLLAAGLERDQIWPMLSISKTALERGLKKLKRRELLEEILAEALYKTTEKYDFRRVENGGDA